MKIFIKKIKSILPQFNTSLEREVFISKILFGVHSHLNCFTIEEEFEKVYFTKINGSSFNLKEEVDVDELEVLLLEEEIVFDFIFYIKQSLTNSFSSSRSFFSEEEIKEAFNLFFKEQSYLIRDLISISENKECLIKTDIETAFEERVDEFYPELKDFDVFEFYLWERESIEEQNSFFFENSLSSARAEGKLFCMLFSLGVEV